LELGEGWVAQQPAWQQGAVQSLAAILGQADDDDACAEIGAICIHVSTMLNKMAESCFTGR
jgi:hypothetical protein